MFPQGTGVAIAAVDKKKNPQLGATHNKNAVQQQKLP